MAEALAHGQRPSKVARADADSLNCMLLPQGGARLDPLWEAVKAMEPERIRIYLQVHLTGLGWQCFLEEILAPLLDRFDISWAKGEVGVYHEHLLTEELEDLWRRMQQVLSVREGRARVLLCTLPGERHRLGMLMGALRHAGKGVHTRLMGVDLPLSSIAQAAEHLNADDVVVSVTIHNTGEPMRRMLLELKPLLPQGCTLHIEGKGAARIKRIPGVNRVAGLGAA